MDVHGPYLGGDDFSYRNKFRAEWLWRKAAVRDPDSITDAEHEELRTNYRREVEYLDGAIGNLLEELDDSGELQNTFVVLTADHGDEFYDELTHVPLIIRPPAESDLPQGETVDELVRCMDILPTLIDAIGASLSEQHQERLAGETLLPLVRGQGRDEEPMVVTEKRVRGEDDLRIGFRTTQWKYLYDGTDDNRYLYNLEEDPEETTDVSEQNQDVVDEFETHLHERLTRIDETSANVDIPDLETDAGVEERLKALGYRE
jgi:arylsulfatase A-like enzyme